MGQVIACGNLKGGTGKSTIAVNVACALAGRGHTVIVLDVDPQGTSRRWAGRGLLPVWAEAAPPVGLHGRARWPARAMELAGTFDLVMLDLPPLVGPALAGASMIADLVLVPITPSGVDVQPTAEALRILRTARESRGGHKPKGLLVPNKVDDRGHYDEATRQAFDSLPERWSPPISQDTAHVNAFAAGAWVGSHAPGSGAADEIEALTNVIASLLGDLARMPSAVTPRDRAPRPTRRSRLSSAGAASGPEPGMDAADLRVREAVARLRVPGRAGGSSCTLYTRTSLHGSVCSSGNVLGKRGRVSRLDARPGSAPPPPRRPGPAGAPAGSGSRHPAWA